MKIAFGPFILDDETRRLMTAEQQHHLSRKAFDLLVMLAADRPRVVTKELLQQRLWPATFVDEANLANLVAEIRSVLGDSPRDSAYIRTVHRVGYSFCGDGQIVATGGGGQPGRPACWLEWGAQRFLLPVGEHVIGRDADVAVSLNDSSVSRRHARLLVTTEQITLDDVASKNGTFHNGTRVTSPVALANGDIVGIGSLRIAFRVPAPFDSTETRVVGESS